MVFKAGAKMQIIDNQSFAFLALRFFFYKLEKVQIL